MSIMCAVYLPEGIVIAADSRLTSNTTYMEGPKADLVEKYTLTDNAQKIVLLSKVRVGIAACGDAIFEGKTISDYLRIFESTQVKVGDTVSTVAQKLFDYAKPYRARVIFFVCGYDGDEPFVFDVGQTVTRKNKTHAVAKGEVDYGVTWSGKQDAVTKLLTAAPAMRINFQLFPLKDGIDFAEFIIDTTIKYERFKDEIQTCAGPIDILVLAKSDSFWYKHKIYKP